MLHLVILSVCFKTRVDEDLTCLVFKEETNMSNCQRKLKLNVSHVHYCMDSTFGTVLIITSRLHAIDQLLQAKNKLLKIPQ